MSFQRVFVSDFDGTLTYEGEKAKKFKLAYVMALSRLTGVLATFIRGRLAALESAARKAPGKYGWDIAGRIVAPMDHNVACRMVANQLFDELGKFQDPAGREQQLDTMYRTAYEQVKDATRYRPGVAELFSRQCSANVEQFIITNSAPDVVIFQVKALAGMEMMASRVRGLARKYVIDDEFIYVSDTIEVPGLGRPLYLRRKRYYEALDELRRQCRARWDEVTVLGDNFELDLALPLYLGARIVLITTERTPDYERNFVATSGRGRVINLLGEL